MVYLQKHRSANNNTRPLKIMRNNVYNISTFNVHLNAIFYNYTSIWKIK